MATPEMAFLLTQLVFEKLGDDGATEQKKLGEPSRGP